jgi:hypothetical protein
MVALGDLLASHQSQKKIRRVLPITLVVIVLYRVICVIGAKWTMPVTPLAVAMAVPKASTVIPMIVVAAASRNSFIVLS